ncbi:MAG TPA: NUDIX hydrolase [Thermoanaerobaculia bacterium]
MKRVYEGEHLNVVEHDGWQFVERKPTNDAVAVVAETDDGQLVLTEQFRRPVAARVIDFPAGLVGDEEGTDDPEETAKKELEEETGFSCQSVELLCKGPSSPGITSEIVSLYRASGVRRTGEGGGVGGEDIEVHLVPKADLAAWLRERQEEGIMVDLKLAIYAAEQDLNRLVASGLEVLRNSK